MGARGGVVWLTDDVIYVNMYACMTSVDITPFIKSPIFVIPGPARQQRNLGPKTTELVKLSFRRSVRMGPG